MGARGRRKAKGQKDTSLTVMASQMARTLLISLWDGQDAGRSPFAELSNCGWHGWAGEALENNMAMEVGQGLDPHCG